MIGYQEMIAWALLIVAIIMAGKKFLGQFGHVEVDPKCEECPVPGLIKDKGNQSK